MQQPDYLRTRYPQLSAALPRMQLAALPTPVREFSIAARAGKRKLSIKLDNLTGEIYGGNKIRKLEYIFPRARNKQCERIATFGAASSNHALATAIYARKMGFDCTCFLSHQTKTALTASTLNKHIENRTEIVRYGGSYRTRIKTLREHLWNQRAFVIPMGGSSWLGTIGFVAAGLELATQIDSGEVLPPDRIYVATGTMGTVAGIGIGLALAGMRTELHAIRVSNTSITNDKALHRLITKTATMMRRLDQSVPPDIENHVNIVVRNRFFGPGYAHSTPAADDAIRFAKDELDLTLESTYTGKAFAALLADLVEPEARQRNILYWHTFNSAPLNVPADRPLLASALPDEFLRYFSSGPD